MIVKVKGVGVKLAGKWCFINETAEISKEEYENNKEYVEIIQEDITEPENPEGEQNNNSDINTSVNIEKDIELEELKEKAKELGINITHNMKKETIMKKIEESEKTEPENPEGE